MSEVVPVEQQSTPAVATSEQRQLEVMWRQAQRLANSDLVPKDLKGKPENVVAVALYGRQFGLDPATAVSNIWIISGRMVPSAQVLAGVSMRAGHEVRIPEQSAEKCVVEIRRRGTDYWQRVTCTSTDVQKAGLAGRDIWKQYPSDMLGHFTMRRAVKRICPDALLGLDIGGDDGVPVASTAPEAPERVEATHTPDRIIEVQLSDDEVRAVEAGPHPLPMTPEQSRHLHALLRDVGIAGDHRHPAATEFFGRPISSLNELTKDEASEWIAALMQQQAS